MSLFTKRVAENKPNRYQEIIMLEHKYPLAKKQQGFTLIEILIAMMIGAFLLTGIVEIFVNAKQTYRMQDAISDIQESGRLAMDYIGRDIRLAGYRPIVCPNYVFPAKPAQLLDLPPLSGVNDDTNSSAIDKTLNGTDSISLNWVVPTVIGGVLSCDPANPGGSQSYWIHKDTKSLRRGAEELVQGIENMQILYGIDATTDGVADYYIGDISALASQVVTVRVSLLVSSVENVATKPIPYYFNDIRKTPASTDRKIRRVFTSTFAVRNSLL